MKHTFSPKGRKVISLLLVILMLATFAVGCGSNNNSATSSSDTTSSNESNSSSASTNASGGVTELTYWAQADRQEAFDPITKEFNESNKDVHVTVAYYDTDGLKNACKVGAASGTLADMWFNWGGSLGQYYVDNGLTYDLTSYAEKNSWSNKFKESALSLCTLDGKLSGYPTNVSVLGMFYNKAIFDKYGIQIPSSLEDLEKAAATLKQNGVTPFSTAGLHGWHVMRIIEQLIEYYAGTDHHDKLQTMDTSWDDPAVISAFTKYQEWCKLGYFPEGFLTNDPNDTFIALAKKKAAMDLQGQWYDGTITSNEQKVEDYGWFPFPNKTGRMSAFVEMTQINSKLDEAKVDKAVKYLDFVFSAKNADTYSQYLNLPLASIDAKIADGYPHIKEMYDYANEKGTFTITDQAFPAQVADVLFRNQDALYGNKTDPKAAAADIEAAIKSYKSSSK